MTNYASTQLPMSGNMSLYNNPFVKKKPLELTTPQTQKVSSVKITLPQYKQNPLDPTGKFGFSNDNNEKMDWSLASLLPKNTNNSTSQPYKTNVETPTPPTTPPKVPTAYEAYMAGMNNLAAKRKQQANDNYTSNVDYETKNANDANSALLSSIDPIKANLETFKKTTANNAVTQKQNVENNSGEFQLLAAKTRIESEGRNRNRFAALNTADSFGAGSYDAAQTNTESDFNKTTQYNLQDKKTKLDLIDTKSESDIQTEIQKFNDYVIKVQSSVNLNNAQKDKAIRDAKYATQTAINTIDDNTYTLKYQALQAQNTDNLSVDKDQNKVLTMVDRILSSDTRPITGTNRIVIPGRKGSVTKADYEGLKNLLTLAGRGKLKGSGAVSDFETKMLEKAAMAGIDTTMPDPIFRQRLQVLRDDLSKAGAVSSTQVKMQGTDGNTYMVDPSEAELAKANGWRTI